MAQAETIVCGVDGSDEARNAIAAAHALAGRLGARLVVVHVAPDPAVPGASAAAGGLQRVAAAEEEEARRLVEETLDEAGVQDAEVRVVFGRSADQSLVAAAREEDAGLIVVGARGRGAVASAVLGSVSSGVVANAGCPVLVIPGDKAKLGLLGR
jgi:nucleotide-binding universal stress UspA family protein